MFSRRRGSGAMNSIHNTTLRDSVRSVRQRAVCLDFRYKFYLSQSNVHLVNVQMPGKYCYAMFKNGYAPHYKQKMLHSRMNVKR